LTASSKRASDIKPDPKNYEIVLNNEEPQTGQMYNPWGKKDDEFAKFETCVQPEKSIVSFLSFYHEIVKRAPQRKPLFLQFRLKDVQQCVYQVLV
jgi:hypothetical protein